MWSRHSDCCDQTCFSYKVLKWLTARFYLPAEYNIFSIILLLTSSESKFNEIVCLQNGYRRFKSKNDKSNFSITDWNIVFSVICLVTSLIQLTKLPYSEPTSLPQRTLHPQPITIWSIYSSLFLTTQVFPSSSISLTGSTILDDADGVLLPWPFYK